MFPKLNLSKVQSLIVTPLGDGIGVQVTYKSKQRRGYTYGPDELGLGDLIVAARKAGIDIKGLCDKCESAFPTTSILYVDTPLALCDTCAASVVQPQEPLPPEGGIWCQWCGERPSLPGVPCEVCQKMGANPDRIEEQTGIALAAQPNALVLMLGLSPQQAEALKGADRLNFWRNGSLNVQANHGSRGVKLACPKAVVTDAQLDDFFASWGWQKLGSKPYFKPNQSSLVRL